MKPEDMLLGGVHETAPPPSAVIRDFSHQESVTESEVTELAKHVLLPVSEVQIR